MKLKRQPRHKLHYDAAQNAYLDADDNVVMRCAPDPEPDPDRPTLGAWELTWPGVIAGEAMRRQYRKDRNGGKPQ